MPGEMRIYFEGDKSLKAGFDVFFGEIKAQAKTAKWRVSVIATGGTPERDFAIAMRKHQTAWNILLRDSEGPLNQDRPQSQAGSIFWMVETMESWFHADKDALAQYYKSGFRKEALSANPKVEEIPKQDLIDGLKAATRDTKKGKYHKTKHAPVLLQSIEPSPVRRAAPNCDRLFKAVLDRLG